MLVISELLIVINYYHIDQRKLKREFDDHDGCE